MLAEWKEYNLYNPIICKIVKLTTSGINPKGYAFVLPLYEHDWRKFQNRDYVGSIGSITYNKLKLVSIDYLTIIDQEKIPKDILRDSKISDILS